MRTNSNSTAAVTGDAKNSATGVMNYSMYEDSIKTA